MSEIVMVDLKTQYQRIKQEIDEAVLECLGSSAFIKGPAVKRFEADFAQYQGAGHVIGCGNGTDALQLALMALDLEPGDQVIVPAFTYIATAEVIALLRLTPVMVDVDPDTFNISIEAVRQAITAKTRAIVPVHLYGQCADMNALMELAEMHNIAIVEDAAQATGTKYSFRGEERMAGAMGTIGCTSFFPTKNLGCYGDGGALMTNDDGLANKLSMLANHGQNKKYYHAMVGVNSRLDTVQAAILEVKLRYLDDYIAARQSAANFYNNVLSGIEALQIPQPAENSTHSYHQYTLKVKDGRRNALQQHLSANGVPSVVYYPLPLHRQKAFAAWDTGDRSLEVTERLCEEVLSLPIHTELDEGTQQRICETVAGFFD